MRKLKKNIAISESGFIFDSHSGESYKVNAIGRKILYALQIEKPYEELEAEIILEYDVSKEMFERYYEDFMSTLNGNMFFEE